MKTKNNVLYISYDGLTDPLGQSQILPYLTNLSELNYNITIVSAEKPKAFEQHKSKIQKICDEANISWNPIQYTASPPLISTIKDIKTLKKTCKDLHLEKNFKIIHCRSYISALIGLYLKRKFGVKFLFDMRGFWADERIDGGIWKLSNPIFKTVYNYFKRKETQFLKESDHIISLTINGKNEMSSWPLQKNLSNKITVIPCCADLEHFNFNKTYDSSQFKKQLDIKDSDFVITYLGSIGTWYMLDEMLDFFKIQLNHKPNSIFLFISKDDPSVIENACRAKDIALDRIRIQPCERENLPKLLSIVNVSIFFILPAFSKKASSPTKQAELLGMGIPLICNSNVGDTDEIIKKENAGVVFGKLSGADFKNSMEEINKLTSMDKNHLREIAINHFSLESGVKRYSEVYAKLSK